MKAPDKIYIPYYPNDNGLDTHLGDDWFDNKDIDQYVEGWKEYFRKDALIEWLENKINISDGGFVNGLTYLAYRDVIEHLNEM